MMFVELLPFIILVIKVLTAANNILHQAGIMNRCKCCKKYIDTTISTPFIDHLETSPLNIYHQNCIINRYTKIMNNLEYIPKQFTKFISIASNSYEYQNFVFNLKLYIVCKYKLQYSPSLIPDMIFELYMKRSELYESFCIVSKIKTHINDIIVIFNEIEHHKSLDVEIFKIFSCYNISEELNLCYPMFQPLLSTFTLKNDPKIDYRNVIEFLRNNTIKINNLDMVNFKILNKLIALMDIEFLYIDINSNSIKINQNHFLNILPANNTKVQIMITKTNILSTYYFLKKCFFKAYWVNIWLFCYVKENEYIHKLISTLKKLDIKQLRVRNIYHRKAREIELLILFLYNSHLKSLTITFKDHRNITTHVEIIQTLSLHCNKYGVIDHLRFIIAKDISLKYIIGTFITLNRYILINEFHLIIGNMDFYNDIDVNLEEYISDTHMVVITKLFLEINILNVFFNCEKSEGMEFILANTISATEFLQLKSLKNTNINYNFLLKYKKYDNLKTLELIGVFLCLEYFIKLLEHSPNLVKIIINDGCYTFNNNIIMGKPKNPITLHILQTNSVHLMYLIKYINIFNVNHLIIYSTEYDRNIELAKEKYRDNIFISYIEYNYELATEEYLTLTKSEKINFENTIRAHLRSIFEKYNIKYNTLEIKLIL